MVAGFSSFAPFLGFAREGLWRSAALHSRALFERIMEDWRREFDGALKQGLEELDDEFDQNLAQNILEEMVRETCPAPKRPKIGSSRIGRRYVYRKREACDERLYRDYFAENATFDALKFRRRFRMSRDLFLHIVHEVCAFDPSFVQKHDGLGRLGLSSLQKCIAAIRMLAYGIPANTTDEYCWTGESTTI